MFSRVKSQRRAQEPSSLPDEVPDPSQPSRKASAKPKTQRTNRGPSVPSIISGDMAIRGVIESTGEVQYDGQLEGDIHAKTLIVGDGASVEGEITAEKVRISGTVKGAIKAIEVEMANTAIVTGDITHKSLMIESGARFEGKCQYSDEPLGTVTPQLALSSPPADNAQPTEAGGTRPSLAAPDTNRLESAAPPRRRPTPLTSGTTTQGSQRQFVKRPTNAATLR
ncbi:hypothetical protein PB2503_01052 [Parvularcula bermudensis HTCC2503]|uniref:Polymer-forming cytoskeletal protein n=1 Tax=Parvularcula bermudensis (strain ATCC BAA-594 / HTCC2503 / KCTC 12087) TaxID=314260 RepID=E0TB87_PARBH|nr:polymer-forming cytoskeletal protein [Parvularcula bermudensis]ADM08291.1 hypothetical protein PB2503_01052 [Parvularcula bermudensis HTCC2503]